MAYDVDSDRMILVTAEPFGRPPPHWTAGIWAYDYNANLWTNLSPRTSPPAEFGLAAAYDTESDRVILFGGGTTSGSRSDTWAYDYNSNTWTNLTSGPRPSGRYNHAMAYDEESDRIILFGGSSGENDTWAYDYNTNIWTNSQPTSGPPGRADPATAYDRESDRTILFGGWAYVNATYVRLNDTWAYDYNSNTWTNLTTFQAPPDGWMAYDAESDRIVLLGKNNETWVYDYNTNTWTNLRPVGPSPVGWIAYDAESDRMILFAASETWSYDFNANAWTAMLQAPWQFSPMAYDSESDRIIAFDGLDLDPWAYDLNTNSWSHLEPTAGPQERYEYAIAYDAESDRVVLFGGYTPTESWLNDTWAYDYNKNTWTNLQPTSGPPGRAGHVMAYDGESDRVILVGGFAFIDARSITFDDTWAYDFNSNTWTNLKPTVAASLLWQSAMAYDEESDRVILLARDERFDQVDTWAYDFNSDTWTNRNSGPPGQHALYGYAMAYDSDADRLILFGGSTSSGESDETWAYDYGTNSWTFLDPAVTPAARSSHGMAYDSESHLTVLFGGSADGGTWWYKYFDLAPSAPRNLQASEGNRKVFLTWEVPSDTGTRAVTGYRIYRFTWASGLSIVATVGLILNFTDSGLTNGVLYYYWVSAQNAVGEGALSNSVSATPRVTLGAPPNLDALAGMGEVSLSWQAASSGDDSPITGYRVYRGTSSSQLSIIATVGNILSFADTNVTNGVTYYYRVSAMSGTDEGPRSSEAIATPREFTKPTISILSPNPGSTLGSPSVIVSGTASDDTTILRVELSLDSTNWTLAAGTTAWSGRLELLEGPNTIYARVTDTSGNTETTTVAVILATGITLVAVFSSPIVITAIAIGAAALVGAFLVRRWRSRRWEDK